MHHFAETPLLDSVPEIRRAREYHLYTADNRRLLDLYQNDGRALLGHRPSKISHTLKQRLSQGLYASLPSPHARRAHALAQAMFASHTTVRLYTNPERAIAAIETALDRSITPDDIFDPAIDDAASPIIACVRALLPIPHANILLPIVPFPGDFVPQLVCADPTANWHFPASNQVSAMLAHALTTSLSAWRRLDSDAKNPSISHANRSDIVHPMGLFDDDGLQLWQRRGPYIAATCSPDAYGHIFRRFLERNMLLHPNFPGPSILPLECTRREFDRFTHTSIQVYDELS